MEWCPQTLRKWIYQGEEQRKSSEEKKGLLFYFINWGFLFNWMRLTWSNEGQNHRGRQVDQKRLAAVSGGFWPWTRSKRRIIVYEMFPLTRLAWSHLSLVVTLPWCRSEGSGPPGWTQRSLFDWEQKSTRSMALTAQFPIPFGFLTLLTTWAAESSVTICCCDTPHRQASTETWPPCCNSVSW